MDKDYLIVDEKTTFIGDTVKIGKNVKIYENNRIEGNTIIGDNSVILPNCYIVDCEIGENTTINFSQLEGATIGKDCSVGPFARIRPKTKILNKVKIGNFVEIKNSTIGNNTKVSHLAYVGDAEIGEDCNIGCGVIFVNYNGKEKQKSIVGDNCFIGSNCNVIAPIVIEDNSYICAGTTVTDNVKNNDFVIGRVVPTIKENRAKKYLKKFKE